MKRIVDIIALVLVVVSAINWGIGGLFELDVVAWLFSGTNVVIGRIIYIIIGIAGIWCINLIFVRIWERKPKHIAN